MAVVERARKMGGMVILVISGAGIYLMLWSGHHLTPNPDGAGEWRSVPSWVAPWLRRGQGPVLIGSVLVQLAAAVMFATGFLRYLGLLPYPASAVAAYIMVGSWVLALVSWGLIELRARRWRREATRPHPGVGSQDDR